MMARRLLIGAVWSVASRVLGRAVDLVTLLVLARLLTPADFGVVAVAMTLVTILEAVFELPVGTVLLCRPELDAADLDTAFTLSFLRGGVLAGVALLLAYPFARLYGDAHLLGLIAVLSVAPAARGLASPRMVLFSKALDFRRNFIADVAGRGVACGLATATALLWRDHWAIVASTVAGPAATSLATYLVAPYRPRFSLARWPAFRHFLGWSSAAQLVSALNWQCDRLLLGHLVPRAALGQFSMASDLSAIPNQSLILPLMTPTLSAFTQIAGERALREAYVRAVSAILTLGLPILVGLSLVAEPLVAVILGGKWNNASGLLRWLALESVPYLFVMPTWPLAMARGHVRLLVQRNVLELAVKIPLMIAAVSLFGIPGAVASRIIMAAVLAGVSMHLTRGLIGLPIGAQIGAHWRPIAACGAMTMAVLAVRGLVPGLALLALPQLAAEACAGAAVYAVALLAFGFNPRHLLGIRTGAETVEVSTTETRLSTFAES